MWGQCHMPLPSKSMVLTSKNNHLEFPHQMVVIRPSGGMTSWEQASADKISGKTVGWN